MVCPSHILGARTTFSLGVGGGQRFGNRPWTAGAARFGWPNDGIDWGILHPEFDVADVADANIVGTNDAWAGEFGTNVAEPYEFRAANGNDSA